MGPASNLRAIEEEQTSPGRAGLTASSSLLFLLILSCLFLGIPGFPGHSIFSRLSPLITGTSRKYSYRYDLPPCQILSYQIDLHENIELAAENIQMSKLNNGNHKSNRPQRNKIKNN